MKKNRKIKKGIIMKIYFIVFFLGSCADFKKDINDFTDSVIGKSFSSSKESLEAIDKLVEERKFKKRITLRKSTKSRMRLRKGQSVTYLEESTSSEKNKRIVKFMIVKASANETIIEVHEWDSRDEAEEEISGYELKNFPLKPKFIYTEEDNSKIGHQVRSLGFRVLKEGKIVKERHSKDTNKNEDLNQIAVRALLGHMFNRYKLEEAKPEKCETEAIVSKRCFVYNGIYRNIIGKKEKEKVYMHHMIPITGIVKAVGEDYTYTMISYSKKDKKYRLY